MEFRNPPNLDHSGKSAISLQCYHSNAKIELFKRRFKRGNAGRLFHTTGWLKKHVKDSEEI